MKKAILFIAGLMLLLTFAQCKKDKDPEEPSGSTETLPFETVEAIVNDSVSTYFNEVLEDDNLYDALPIVAQRLMELEEVSTAEVHDFDIEITFSDGSKLTVMFRHRDEGGKSLNPKEIQIMKGSSSSKDGKKVLLWEPFSVESSAHFSQLAQGMQAAGLEVTQVESNDCTVASVANMIGYDYIMILTHGRSGGNWFCTHEIATPEKDELYNVRSSRLISWGKVHYVEGASEPIIYSVSGEYIRSIQGSFNNSIVLAGHCHGMDNGGGGLCDAFHEKGASVFCGFDGIVNNYVEEIGTALTQHLVTDRMTMGEAYDMVRTDLPDRPVVDIWGNIKTHNRFRMDENSDRNASLFEAPTYPTGAVNSTFTVNDHGGQVCFAHGNLQYQASTGTWRFAPNQYDHIGDNNAYASSSYSGWIDLFCWGTSGWDSGAQEYQPYSGSTDYSSYYTGGSYSTDLTGAYADADWAYHNPISNGGNQARLWRCLTHEEYIYMMENRANASEKYGYACVNGTNGLVILPDRWVLPSGLSFTPQASSWYSNSYSAEQWTQMESAGAIFLPTTGTRQGTSVFYVDGLGDYWSSTANDYETGCSMSFFNGNVYPGDCRYRYLGTSVRPAHDL